MVEAEQFAEEGDGLAQHAGVQIAVAYGDAVAVGARQARGAGAAP